MTGGRLDGKVALITGAGSGMGRAAAELFASEGRARRRDRRRRRRRATTTVAAVRAAGGDATFVRADVAEWADCEAMVATAIDTYGGLHVLYNNAGIFPADDGGVLDTPEATWDRVMEDQPQGRVARLQGRDPGDARVGRRRDRQRRVVRRADGRGDRADRVHLEQGRRARR